MKRDDVAAEMGKIVSICKGGRERTLPETFRLSAFSTVGRSRVRSHLMRRCGIDVSPAAFAKLKTLEDLIEYAMPLLARRRRKFPAAWHEE